MCNTLGRNTAAGKDHRTTAILAYSIACLGAKVGAKGGLRRSSQTARIGGFGVGADMGIEGVESYTKLKSVVVNLDGTPNPWVDA